MTLVARCFGQDLEGCTHNSKAHVSCAPIVIDIRDINFEQLHKAGIIAIAFDKDNCLTRPYGNELYPPFEVLLRCVV